MSNDDLEPLTDVVRSVDPAALVAAAQRHHVVSRLGQRLLSLEGTPKELAAALAGSRLMAQAHRARLLQGMRRALAALDVPALTLKGQVLATDWYGDPAARDFNDIDLLVRPADFERAVGALGRAGFVPATTNWHGFREFGLAEVPLRLDRCVVDLHWHIVGLAADRRHLHLPLSPLFERARTIRVEGMDLLALDPADTLLHLCVNTGLGGGWRLHSLKDIDVVAGSGRVDITVFVARARAAGAGRLCSAILQRTAAVMGTELPPGLLRDLSPGRTWLVANRVFDRISEGRNTSSSVASGLLLRSGRDTRAATAAMLGRNVRRALAEKRRGTDPTAAGGALDWNRTPADGQVEVHRRAYLDWVRTGTAADGDAGPSDTPTAVSP